MSILVGSLPSREGRAALRVAVDECLARGVDMELVSIANGNRGVTPEEQSAWEGAVVEAERRMSDGGRRLSTHEAESDDIAEALVQYAEASKADLIVIGLRRRTPVGKLLLGSNAQRVLLEAGCPVLAVKAPDGD